MNTLKEKYKVKRSAIEESFINQMGLKNNQEYEKWADNASIAIIEYFLNKYKGITIEMPKAREKSPKSLQGKIKNLQIERLSKLYTVEEINEEERDTLYSLIKERIYENEELNIIYTLAQIKNLLYNEIEKLDIKKFEETIMVEGISNSTKTALLRILVGKLEKSNIPNKESKIEELDEKYGKKAAIKSGLVEDDIIRYSSIEAIKGNKIKIDRLKDEMNFLRANDLRGMKFIVANVPDELETDNKKLKEILKRRKETEDNREKVAYTELAIIEIGKEFYKDLETNEELLKKLNMQVIPDSNKHKKKSNGYEADHIKFFNIEYPEYKLEVQYKSEYVENICRGKGSAAHQNRPGKKRILPHASNDVELIQKLEYTLPKYKIFRKEGNTIKVQKFDMLRNVMGFYQGEILPKSEEYEKIMNVFGYDKKENNR